MRAPQAAIDHSRTDATVVAANGSRTVETITDSNECRRQHDRQDRDRSCPRPTGSTRPPRKWDLTELRNQEPCPDRRDRPQSRRQQHRNRHRRESRRFANRPCAQRERQRPVGHDAVERHRGRRPDRNRRYGIASRRQPGRDHHGECRAEAAVDVDDHHQRGRPHPDHQVGYDRQRSGQSDQDCGYRQRRRRHQHPDRQGPQCRRLGEGQGSHHHERGRAHGVDHARCGRRRRH